MVIKTFYLGKLYEDFFEMFDTDIFHMGGDEVNLNCWNTSQEIRKLSIFFLDLFLLFLTQINNKYLF